MKHCVSAILQQKYAEPLPYLGTDICKSHQGKYKLPPVVQEKGEKGSVAKHFASLWVSVSSPVD